VKNINRSRPEKGRGSVAGYLFNLFTLGVQKSNICHLNLIFRYKTLKLFSAAKAKERINNNRGFFLTAKLVEYNLSLM
jgi:hypothetical protein